MKILITGSNGQLGTELYKILREGISELGKIPESLQDSIVFATDVDELDITDIKAVEKFFSKNKPDIVFNCAAMTNVDGCERDEEIAYRINAEGPKNLATISQCYGARLIHISTDYVFFGDGTIPYNESDTTNPNTVYGRSKLAGEQFVLNLCANSCVCRTAWLYGYVGNNFVKTMLRLAREKGTLTVVNDQVGNPTSAVDLAYQLVLLAASQEMGIFHCTCNGEPVSWYTFAKRVVEKAKLDVSVNACTTEQFPRPAKRPAFSALDNRNLRETIGDNMRKWEEALDSFLESYLEREGMS
ncbi:MAG: dTDP-4-dehydrorhamnose reductase [Tissierellia bacterium]|nr:dTDP-4-dehydrorhamnose reductase [Tissierellia bacterium]